MKAKLPVYATLVSASASVFSRRVLLSGFFVRCFVAYMVYAQLFHFISTLPNRSENLFFINTVSLVSYFILAPFFIGIHRFVILGEDFPSNPFKEFFGKRNINFAAYCIIFFLPTTMLNVIVLQNPEYGIPSWIGTFGLFLIPYYFVLLRALVYFPYVAIDDQQTLSTCWQLTRKSAWRFFWLAVIYGVIVMIPIVLMMYMLGLDNMVAFMVYTPEALSDGRNFPGRFHFDFMFTLYGFISAAFFVAIISHAFIFFTKEEKVDVS